MNKYINKIIDIIKMKSREKKQKTKLGVTYSVFNGEEILPYSIMSIRSSVDYINVVYQLKSWTGTECSTNLLPLLNKLKSDGLVDNIIEYTVRNGIKQNKMGEIVLRKKNIGIKDLKRNGCTHCLIMDADELYMADDFAKAKEFIIKNNITHSACPIYDYRYYPEIRYRDTSKYSVPFIFKIRFLSKLSHRHHMPCHVDDLRTFRYSRFFDKFYYLNTICMHHMTGLRKNYGGKLEATITNFSPNGKEFIETVRKKDEVERQLSIDELIEKKTGENGGYIKVENTFNISIKE